MRQFFLTLLTALPLLSGCSFTAITPNSGFTPRPPYTNDMGFVVLADVEVKKVFPEWYVEGVTKKISPVAAGPRFASVKQLEDGTFVMTIYPMSLALTTLGDLTVVLLHEYVHVKIWARLAEEIPDPYCNSAIHEMTAYGTELSQLRVRTTEDMHYSTQMGYSIAYMEAQFHCPIDLYIDFAEPDFTWYDN